MKKLFTALALAVTLFSVNAHAKAEALNIEKLHNEMLYPVVQVEAKGGLGSGTVIASKYVSSKTNETATYILTNNHVIEDAVSIDEVWDSDKSKNVKRETRMPVMVRFYQYNNLSRYVGTLGKTADIIAYDKKFDLAVLRIRDTENLVQHVAHIIPKDKHVYLFKKTWAVGGGLGFPPFPTEGILSGLDVTSLGVRYLLSSAPIIFGNSGGALFHYSVRRDRYELIGVPSAVSVAQMGFSASPVSHMSWVIPTETIYKFLKKANLKVSISD